MTILKAAWVLLALMVMVAVSLLARLVPTPPLGVALGLALAPSSRPVPTTPLGPPWPIWWVAVRLTLPPALSLLD